MKLFIFAAALVSLSVCSLAQEDFDCPLDVHGQCVERRYYHTDCTQYWRCFESEAECIAVVFDCADYLHFDEILQECVQPEESGCEPGRNSIKTRRDPDDVSAFSVSRTTDWKGGEGDLEFDKIDVNLGGCFKDGKIFEPGRDGVYFISFSGGIPAETTVDIKIRPMHYPNYPSTIHRESTSPEDTDMMYRNFLTSLDASAFLSYKAFTPIVSGNRSLQTSFSGFSLTDMFTDVQAFYAAREESFYEQGARIPMSRVYMDIGENYDETEMEFTAPKPGSTTSSLELDRKLVHPTELH